LINNLPSGYHRDFQLLKDICFPAIEELKICLKILTYLIPAVHPREKILDKEIYKYIGSVDSLNEKVRNGLSFRDAYREIADEIREGKYKPVEEIKHSHAGSIGNLSLDRISDKMNTAIEKTRAKEYSDFNVNFCEKCKKEYK
jgi:argininosuccinate lyase